MSSKDCLFKKYSEKKCVKALKNINDIEDKINVELEKAKLLLLLLNCENLDNIKPKLKIIFEKIQKMEEEVAILSVPDIILSQ
jgi:hypothetical protein